MNNNVSFSNESSNEESSINNNNLGNFSFIEVDEKIQVFRYNPFNKNSSKKKISNFNPFYFLENKDDFKLIINIFIEDDSFNNSDKLRKIFNLLFLSLNDLNELNLSNKNILVTLFFSNFSSEKTFNQLFPYTDYLSAIYNNKEFLCSSCYIVSSTGIPLNILCFYKNKSTKLESLKLFYSYIIFDIKFFEEYNKKNLNNFLRNENIIKTSSDEVIKMKSLKNNDLSFYVLNWGLGIIPSKTSIGNLIRTTGENNITIIPKITSIPYNKKFSNIFGTILTNYYIIKDIENYFYFINTSVPIDHRFNFMRIDKNNFDVIKKYFINNICIDSSNHYNDYKFSLYLYNNYYVDIPNKKKEKIYYISDIEVIYYENKINFNDFMNIYCSNNIGEYLSLIDNFYQFIFIWNDMTFKKFIKKMFQIFHIISLFFNFILFGLTFIIIKIILSEAFTNKDERIINFFLIVYMLIIIISMIFSVMSPNIHKNDITFELINILFVAYFLFILLCSVFAILNIKKENDKSHYTYKRNPMIILIVVNLVFYFSPYILDFRHVKKNIINLILYIIVYPSILTIFNLYIQVNVIAYYGRNLNYINYKNTKSNNNIINERKKTYILIYIFTNFIFIFLIFFLTDRSINMSCVNVLTIIFTSMHGFKVINIFIGYIHTFFFVKKHIKSYRHSSTVINEDMKKKIFGENYIIEGTNNENGLLDNNKEKEEELIKNNLTSATTIKNDNKSNNNNNTNINNNNNKTNINNNNNNTNINNNNNNNDINKTYNKTNLNYNEFQDFKELFNDLKPSMEISNINKKNNNNIKFEIKLNNKTIN